RPSANVLMGRLLNALEDVSDYYIISIKGGEVDNAICRKCEAEIAVSPEDTEAVRGLCDSMTKELRCEYRGIDDDITILCTKDGNGAYTVCDDFGREKIICLLRNLPYGVMARSAYDINQVETSLNLGVLSFKEGILEMLYSVRSSMESAKRDIADRLEYLAEFLGGDYEESGNYPAWTYNPNSHLRELISTTYENMFGNKPKFTTIHAGLECGIFAEKIPGVDIVSYGPDMKDIHTYEEKLSVESTERVYKFTLKLLENIRS
ncbi:MAG: M20/M25/M40 family metallo-hydrolase, partial [Butyrivibrio sp.]